jgi:hypothetical protein
MNKESIEQTIMERNIRHSRQSLKTPFAADADLAKAVNPNNDGNEINNILNGTFLSDFVSEYDLSETERAWVTELERRLDIEISTTIHVSDFISFFKKRKERTASSPSGRHMGHYKVIAAMASSGNTLIAEILVMIINIAIITSRPLRRWKRSAQVMIEKGKGKYIEHLRIIQLCEADLNFMLNIIWGHRLTRHAVQHNQFNTSQYAIPGCTCNSAVWNKVLYCDLMRQTLSSGIMTDYDATTAFDRVLHSISVITCQRLGLPLNASLFLFNLLQNMEFHLVTGYGVSTASFNNNDDPLHPGQGVLQGSSSAAPLYNFNTDVSLSTYQKLASGSVFTHPITGLKLVDHATQYVDDKTEMINTKGLPNINPKHSKDQQQSLLFEVANKNTDIWSEILWISGGNLNPEKYFYYYIHPQYNHATGRIQYQSRKKAPGDIFLRNPDTKTINPLRRIEPHEGRRTPGVILAPVGNCSQQKKTSMDLAATYIGKIKHSKLTKHAKWTAVTTILEPAVPYPLMAINSSKKDLKHIDKVLTAFKCHALGLNKHFPRAVLHGPMALGGMSIPNTVTKNTST